MSYLVNGDSMGLIRGNAMTPTVTFQQAKASLHKVRPALCAVIDEDDIYSIGIVRDGEDWAYRAELRHLPQKMIDQEVFRIDGIPVHVERVGGAQAVAANNKV